MRQSIRANRKNNIIYLNNPKVGCSTIKSNLWQILSPETFRKDGDVHDVKSSPFSNKPVDSRWISTANIFTFVRNPFTRAVSAFLNKIEAGTTIPGAGFPPVTGLRKTGKSLLPSSSKSSPAAPSRNSTRIGVHSMSI